ncbi:MAG: cupin domain-containing protein [Loktanella sp.]|nr:cupin domain-containing protein [Loktanella sp.]
MSSDTNPDIEYELAPGGLGHVKVEHGNPIYPEPFRNLVDGLVRKRLGDAFGLGAFGVNLVELQPGYATSQKHWHSVQDELVFVLEGHLRLVTDQFELDLGPGDYFGFKGGVSNGHHFMNTGQSLARLVEIGSRSSGDRVTYSDIDMIWVDEEPDHFFRKDGSRY